MEIKKFFTAETLQLFVEEIKEFVDNSILTNAPDEITNAEIDEICNSYVTSAETESNIATRLSQI